MNYKCPDVDVIKTQMTFEQIWLANMKSPIKFKYSVRLCEQVLWIQPVCNITGLNALF